MAGGGGHNDDDAASSIHFLKASLRYPTPTHPPLHLGVNLGSASGRRRRYGAVPLPEGAVLGPRGGCRVRLCSSSTSRCVDFFRAPILQCTSPSWSCHGNGSFLVELNVVCYSPSHGTAGGHTCIRVLGEPLRLPTVRRLFDPGREGSGLLRRRRRMSLCPGCSSFRSGLGPSPFTLVFSTSSVFVLCWLLWWTKTSTDQAHLFSYNLVVACVV